MQAQEVDKIIRQTLTAFGLSGDDIQKPLVIGDIRLGGILLSMWCCGRPTRNIKIYNKFGDKVLPMNWHGFYTMGFCKKCRRVNYSNDYF